VKLATINAEQLAAWLCRSTLPGTDAHVELHVLAHHWELRYGTADPFVIEWDRTLR
jgi:hypothetical protein